MRRSNAKCLSRAALSANPSTSAHSCHPSPSLISITVASPPASTGTSLTYSLWPGEPSEVPTVSRSTVLACDAVAVPPTVKAFEILDLGRQGVRGLARRRLGDDRPQPPRSLLVQHAGDVAGGDVDDDVAGPVEAAGVVAFELAADPIGPVMGLPPQRRVQGVDTDALDPAFEPERHRAAGDGAGQADVQGIAGLGHGRKTRRPAAALQRFAVVAKIAAQGLAAQGQERALDDVEVGSDRKYHRFFDIGAHGRHLGPGRDASLSRAGAPTARTSPGLERPPGRTAARRSGRGT